MRAATLVSSCCTTPASLAQLTVRVASGKSVLSKSFNVRHSPRLEQRHST